MGIMSTHLKLKTFSHNYKLALRKYIKQNTKAHLSAAMGLGKQAIILGLETLSFARIHEHSLISLVLPNSSTPTSDAIIKKAGVFFAEALAPIEKNHRVAREANTLLQEMVASLNRRSRDLVLSNQKLKKQIAGRKVVEESLRKSKEHYTKLLSQSNLLQGQLRRLSRQLLIAQEEERKRISRQLHDEIVQTLTGININLSNLKTDAMKNTRGLKSKITQTQRLVGRSVNIVHKFARELRPTMLDDLGLIPALKSYVKAFTARTKIPVRIKIDKDVEKMDNFNRTVLYRIAQEALTNIARHSGATKVSLTIKKYPDTFCLTIADNGKSFQTKKVLRSKSNKRLGLLGMRERIEMVGGRFNVGSEPGKGTTISAEIPTKRLGHVKRL